VAQGVGPEFKHWYCKKKKQKQKQKNLDLLLSGYNFTTTEFYYNIQIRTMLSHHP
jgi:hypothetical protein